MQSAFAASVPDQVALREGGPDRGVAARAADRLAAPEQLQQSGQWLGPDARYACGGGDGLPDLHLELLLPSSWRMRRTDITLVTQLSFERQAHSPGGRPGGSGPGLRGAN